MPNTFANGMSIVHKGDGLQFIAIVPDVCKTPSPGGPVPIPYPNIAMSSDLDKGSKKVKVEGNPAALKNSNIKTSTGDEAGTAGGGIVSSKTKGKVKWMRYSMDVKFEGKGVVRFLDNNMHNGNMTNTNGMDNGKPTPPGDEGKIICDNCGKPWDDPCHDNTKMPPNKNSRDAARKNLRGKSKGTVAALQVKCPGQQVQQMTGWANSNIPPPLNANNFGQLARNFNSGKQIKPEVDTDKDTAGNCAEQKVLFAANRAGFMPPGPGCKASMAVFRASGGGKEMEPCRTCKRVLTAMLCTNDPKGD